MSTRKKIEGAIQEALRKLQDGADVTNPSLPIWTVDAELALESERQRFEGGDKAALLAAVRICANDDLPLPPWASKAYIRAYDAVLNCRTGSWDDAFGRALKKGTHVAALQRRRRQRRKVWLAVRRAVEHDGRAIDESLFEDVGKALGFGKTRAAELYYEAHRLVSWAYD